MFANNSLLCRLIVRRDRISSAIWIVMILSLVVGYAYLIPDMYPSEAERLILAENFKNPTMVSMIGPVFAEEGYSIGALYSNFMLLWSAVIVAIMNIFFIVRHTRQDEERGRIEVIRSLPVGRLSNLSAALAVSLLMNIIIALLTGLGLYSLGIESMGFEGSMLFGASLGVTGCVFAAVTAAFCQMCASPRTAQGYAFAFLGIMFFVRAIGDIQSELLACISPLGLVLRGKVFAGNIWWPVCVMFLISIVVSALSLYLNSVRDMGEGLIPARPGRKDAAPSLNSAENLAWRLMRTPFLIWSAVALLLGMSYGSLMGELEAFISTNEMFKQIFSDNTISLTEQYVTFLMVLTAIINTIPVLSFLLKVRSQERGGYAENIIARSVSRYAQLRGYVLIAISASIVTSALTAFGFWAASTAIMETPIALWTYIQAALAYLPAMWLMMGVAILLISLLPHLTDLAWVFLGYSFFIVYFGSTMDLPEWAVNISPFSHISKLPVDDFDAVKFSIMIIITALMFAGGFAAYRRRDMKFN